MYHLILFFPTFLLHIIVISHNQRAWPSVKPDFTWWFINKPGAETEQVIGPALRQSRLPAFTPRV